MIKKEKNKITYEISFRQLIPMNQQNVDLKQTIRRKIIERLAIILCWTKFLNTRNEFSEEENFSQANKKITNY